MYVRPRRGALGTVPSTLVLLNVRAYQRQTSPRYYTGLPTAHIVGQRILVRLSGGVGHVGKQLWWSAASTRNPGAGQ